MTATLNRTDQFNIKAQDYCDLLDKLKQAEDVKRRADDDVRRLREHLTARQKDLGEFVGRNTLQRHATVSEGRHVVVTHREKTGGPDILPDMTVFGSNGEPTR